MATKWISPTWRMPEESNQSKFDNYSLNFDGSSNELIDLGTVFDDVFTGDSWTVSSWIYASANTSYDNFFNRGTAIQFYLLSNKIKIFFSPSSMGIYPLSSIATLSLNTWYNIVFTRSGNENKLYINGSLDNSATSTGSIPSQPTSHLTIGSYGNTGNYLWEGKLTEYSIFDYALTDGTGGTENQIGDLYNSGTPINPMAISGNAPVAYYPLGSGSTGSASTLTVPNQSVPSATVFDFDGNNDYFDLGNSVDLRITPNLTVSAWFKTSISQIGKFINRDGFVSGTRDYALYQNGGNLQFWVSQSGNITETVLTSTGFTANDGNWHHAVGVCNGTNIKLYIDGVLNVSGTNSIAGINTSTYINEIGSRTTGTGNFFDGEISNTQIWDTNLSSPEVTTLYNNGVPYAGTQPQAANLKGWWKMNVDTSTWNGSDWIIGEAQANYSSALNFDGIDDYIELNSTQSFANEFSLSIWIKPNGFSNNQVILGNGSGSDNWIRLSSASTITFKIATGSNLNFNDVGNNLVDGVWQHLLFYRDSSNNVGIYRNGTAFSSNQTNTDTLQLTTIGKRGSIEYTGNISNVAFWTSDQSANVTTLYNGGTPETAISFSPTSWWKLNNTTTGIQDSAGSNNGTNNGATVTDIQVSTLNGTSDGMTTANLVNSDLTRSIPYSSYSMQFDGTADRINTSLIDLGLENTISFWAKRNGTDNLDGMIFGGPAAANYYTIFITSVNNLNYRIGSGANAFTNADIVSTLGANEWFHCALVRNNSGADVLCYINGDLKETLTGITGSGNNTIVQNIGARWNTNDFYITCNLSNIGVWSSALTQDQILTIYNGGVPNDISSLSPVSWWSLAGDSYFNGNDFICPDLGSGGNNGTSSGMGGTELVGDGPGSTANGIATSMDIPANLKGNAPNSSKNAFSVNMNSADRVEDVPA